MKLALSFLFGRMVKEQETDLHGERRLAEGPPTGNFVSWLNPTNIGIHRAPGPWTVRKAKFATGSVNGSRRSTRASTRLAPSGRRMARGIFRSEPRSWGGRQGRARCVGGDTLVPEF